MGSQIVSRGMRTQRNVPRHVYKPTSTSGARAALMLSRCWNNESVTKGTCCYEIKKQIILEPQLIIK